ncbi:hypothetical protein RFI_24829, partial [Reticulomyxa filosa]
WGGEGKNYVTFFFFFFGALCCCNRDSFVTHSLGGLIAREALANDLLKPFVKKCHTFISLAVCHCGYLFGRSRALQAGFWVMRSWKKSLALSQLSLTDHDNPRKTFVYQLSMKPGLEYFKNVLLCKTQNGVMLSFFFFVSLETVIVFVFFTKKKKLGRVYNDMVRNLLRPLDHVQLTRFDVSFVNRKINLDSMIGRTAHICFLEQPLYIDIIINTKKQNATKKTQKPISKASQTKKLTKLPHLTVRHKKNKMEEIIKITNMIRELSGKIVFAFFCLFCFMFLFFPLSWFACQFFFECNSALDFSFFDKYFWISCFLLLVIFISPLLVWSNNVRASQIVLHNQNFINYLKGLITSNIIQLWLVSTQRLSNEYIDCLYIFVFSVFFSRLHYAKFDYSFNLSIRNLAVVNPISQTKVFHFKSLLFFNNNSLFQMKNRLT